MTDVEEGDSLESLWAEFAEGDFEALLQERASQTGASPEEFLDRLAESAVASADGTARARRWIGRHLPDLVVLAAALLVLLGLWTVVARKPQPTTVVVASREISAGWVLSADDLELASLQQGSGLLTLDEAVGRVTRRRLGEGEVLRQRDLGAAPPPGSAIVSLPLAAGALELEPGEIVSLYIVAPDGAAHVPGVVVLGVVEGTAMVVTRRQDFAQAAPLLAEGIVIPARH